jgi:alkylation response protein AidB-like acyl-CoA dehydrogenase
MDFRFTEEQKMLTKTARDFLSNKCPKTLVRRMEEDAKGYSAELWQEMAHLGWMGLVFPEKYGGSNMTFLDLAALLEETGRACLPGPFLSTVVLGGLPILDAGTEEQKQEYLPKIASGEAILTLALTEPSARYDPGSMAVKATPEKGAYILSGTKLFVPDAHIADYLLCVTRTDEQAKGEDGITIFLVDANGPGVSYTVLDTMAKDKLCEVVFDGARVPNQNVLGELDQGWGEVQKTMERAAIGKCCEMIGGAQQVLEVAVDYAKGRVQFGQPLGSFGTIQAACADMLVDLESSKLITYEGAWKLSQGLPSAKEVSMAKSWVGDAYRRITVMGQHIYGGIAFIVDHDLPIYFRRAKPAAMAFGDAEFHREKLAQELGL